MYAFAPGLKIMRYQSGPVILPTRAEVHILT